MRDKSEVSESKGGKNCKKVLAFPLDAGLQYQPMKNKSKTEKKPKPIQLRPTVEDFAIIQAGMRKWGLDQSQILRMALRHLAEAEGFKLRAS